MEATAKSDTQSTPSGKWRQLYLPFSLEEAKLNWAWVGIQRPRKPDIVRKNGEALNIVLEVGEKWAKMQGWELYEARFRKRDQGWTLIMKAKKKKTAVITFIDGNSPLDCLHVAKSLIQSKQVRWKPDKYAMNLVKSD